MYSNAELNRLFSPLSDASWNALKLSVRNSPLYLPCSQGTIPLSKGDFVATLSASHNSDRIIDVYSIEPEGHLQFWDRDPDNPFKLLRSIDPPGTPGLHGYPTLKNLYRIHTHTNNTQTLAIGPTYKIISTRDEHLSWRYECFYGILQGLYISPYGTLASSFSSISKNFRASKCFMRDSHVMTTHEASHHFTSICTSHPAVNWRKKFQSLAQAYTQNKCKNTLWRIITNNLYLGPKVSSYLRLKKLDDIAKHYDFCPYCTIDTPCSLQHQFWDCPHIKPFWELVISLLTSHGLPPTLHTFQDLYMFVDETNTHDLLLLFRNDLIYNAIYSIWFDYNNLMRDITNDRLTHQEFTEHVTSLQHHLITKFNSLNRESFLLLPHHVRYLINLKSASTNTNSISSSGLLVRYHLTQPPLNLVSHTFNSDIIDAYNNTWCSQDTLGTITDSKPRFKALQTHQHFPHSPR